MFENELRNVNPGAIQMTYDAPDLMGYIDSLHDASMLVQEGKVYTPMGKTIIKNELYAHLERVYSGGAPPRSGPPPFGKQQQQHRQQQYSR
jgi:hypothetical protein